MAAAYRNSTGQAQDVSGSGTVVNTFDAAVLSGSLLIASVNYDNGGGQTVSSVGDSVNGAASWTSAGGITQTTDGQRTEVWYKENSGAGTPVVTATFSASAGFRSLELHEVTGVKTASAHDKFAGAQGSGTAVSSGSVTTDSDGEFIFAASYHSGTATTDYQLLTSREAGEASNETMDRVQASAGAITAAITLAGSDSWSIAMATFRAAGGTTATRKYPKFPNKGRQPKNYGARRLGFTQGIAGTNLALAIDSAGSITVAGQSVTFGLGLALSTQGSITIQGQSVTPALGLALSAGSVTIQGQSTTFGLGVALSMQGSITIAGQSITLDNGIVLAISTPGSITLQGQAVTFNLGTAVGAGSITLQGQAAGLALGAALAPGSVTIQGQSLTTGFGLALGAGSITIDGQSVTLDLAGALTLAIDVAGSISIDGQIVDLVNSSPTETQTFGPMGPRETVRSMFHASHRPQRKRKDEPAEIVQIPNMAEEPADKLPQTPQVVEPFTTPLAELIGLDLRARLTEKRLELIRQQRSDEEAVLVLMLMMDDD